MPESKWADGFQRSADAGWWSKGPWFSWTYLDDSAQGALLDFVAGAQHRRGVPFNESDPTPGVEGRPVVWVVEDASGSEGGGGGAVYITAE